MGWWDGPFAGYTTIIGRVLAFKLNLTISRLRKSPGCSRTPNRASGASRLGICDRVHRIHRWLTRPLPPLLTLVLQRIRSTAEGSRGSVSSHVVTWLCARCSLHGRCAWLRSFVSPDSNGCRHCGGREYRDRGPAGVVRCCRASVSNWASRPPRWVE